ncbi:PREDICTED: monocarboxylate transporter 13-like [Priapulus caudatus]|uniref:Monocarboxylate transporter 13-like n=1 Tax=Priapulus caudatus TaxID=37621 RepID=A0ABM1DRZ5_PRICU|nr:PREDICTED: monocarboxylate transporter 13-like [Priapulus caudatus]
MPHQRKEAMLDKGDASANDDYYDPRIDTPECDEDLIPTPPDGGWGWVIVASSFFLIFIVDGVCFCFGVWMVEFMDYFNESAAKASLVGSLLSGCYLSAGPLVSALANRYGCRSVTIFGSILASLSFILSTFSPNIEMLIVTFGVMAGIGFGFMYLPAIVSVGYYFETKRALATGVGVSGSGIGTFVMAPLSKYLITAYDWKGATLIVAAIVLHGIICGALMRPLEVTPRKKSLMQRMWEEKQIRVRAFTVHDGYEDLRVHLPLLEKGIPRIAPSSVTPADAAFRSRNNSAASRRDAERPTGSDTQLSHDGRATPVEALQVFPTADDTLSRPSSRELSSSMGVIHEGDDEQPPTTTATDSNLRDRVKSLDSARQHRVQPVLNRSSSRDARAQQYTRPLYRQDIFFSGSVVNLPQYKRRHDMSDYLTSITHIPKMAPVAAQEQQKVGMFERLVGPEMYSVLEEMLDMSLMKHPVFLLICIANILAFIGFFVPFVYTVAYAIEIGIPAERGPILLSIIGIANTVARVLVGWLSDRPGINPLLINNICVIVSGIITMMVPLYGSFTAMAIYCFAFGVTVAGFICLTSIVIVEELGLEKLTNAFGLLGLFRGISGIFGPPLAGFVYDVTKDYNTSFILAGASLTMAGLLMSCIPCLSRCKKCVPSKDTSNCPERNCSAYE